MKFCEVSNYTFELNLCQCVSLSVCHEKKTFKKIYRGVLQINKYYSKNVLQ